MSYLIYYIVQQKISLLLMKDEYQNQINYVPSKYSKSLNYYTKTQLVSVIPTLSAISQTCQYSSSYPIFKIMQVFAKIFMLNEIETIFLGYIVKQTGWYITDKIIYLNAQNVRDVICLSIEQIQYRCLVLYLMICSYTVKYYLNDDTTLFIQQANRICANFKIIFQGWAKKYSAVTSKINPRTLNRVHKQLYLSYRNQAPDYNRMVDAIIQISPAYNPDKKQQQNHIKLPKKNVEVSLYGEKQKSTKSLNVTNSNSNPSLFSSSGIFQMVNNAQFGSNSSNSYVNPMLLKSQKSSRKNSFLMGSSILGMPQPVMLRQDEQQCCDLMLGLRQGESQENIVFNKNTNEKIPEEGPFTSVILLNRGNSFSEKMN